MIKLLKESVYHKNQDSSYWRGKQEEVNDGGRIRGLQGAGNESHRYALYDKRAYVYVYVYLLLF